MASAKPFDLFLSYSSVDRTWVARVKEALEQRGLRVWFDHDQVRPGDVFVTALERGLAESRAIAIVVSPESLASGWVQEEYARAMGLVRSGGEPVQLIPILYREASLPGFLAKRSWIDFQGPSSSNQSIDRLVWGITGARPDTLGGEGKRRALLDRRLVTEMLVLFSQTDNTLYVDSRSQILLLQALAHYEVLLVESLRVSLRDGERGAAATDRTADRRGPSRVPDRALRQAPIPGSSHPARLRPGGSRPDPALRL